jgi:hypothetical protein
MTHKIVLSIILIIILFSPSGISAETEKEQQAISAAMQWLTMIDEGKYAESWKEAATYFKGAIKEDQWEQSLQSVRTPLGKLVSRKVKTKSYQTSLPGAPDGQYVIIQFETSFENKKAAVETVTPMMDKDGKWRVSGYYIK